MENEKECLARLGEKNLQKSNILLKVICPKIYNFFPIIVFFYLLKMSLFCFGITILTKNLYTIPLQTITIIMLIHILFIIFSINDLVY